MWRPKYDVDNIFWLPCQVSGGYISLQTWGHFCKISYPFRYTLIYFEFLKVWQDSNSCIINYEIGILARFAHIFCLLKKTLWKCEMATRNLAFPGKCCFREEVSVRIYMRTRGVTKLFIFHITRMYLLIIVIF